MNSRTVLITGGTGLLGEGFRQTAPAGTDVVGVHLRDYLARNGAVTHRQADVRDQPAMAALFDEYDVDVVVHAAGIASVDYTERHIAESRDSNVAGTLNVARLCRNRGSHFVYVSTNAVFDGTRAPYCEGDPVCPVNEYGRIKAECERRVLEILPEATIVRPILMYGWNHPCGRPNPVTWILTALRKGERVHVVDDVRENPLYNLQCGEALWEVVRRRPAGIFHLAGREILTRYDLAQKVAAAFDLDASLVTRVDSSWFPAIAPRPRNTALATDRMEHELGVVPIDVETGLRRMHAQGAEHVR